MPSVRTASFWIKVGLAVGVVILADWLVYQTGGRGLGLGLALVCISAVLAGGIMRPAIWRSRLGVTAISLAGFEALFLIERVSVLGLLIVVISLAVAMLAPRAARGDDAGAWFVRLAVGTAKAAWGPICDLRRVAKARVRARHLRVTAMVGAVLLPLIGGLVFLGLFAAANPVIAEVLANLRLPEIAVGRLIFWTVFGLVIWGFLRPRGTRLRFKPPQIAVDGSLPGIATGSVTASLVVFNALFALQNGLDFAFLAGGAPLPHGVTMTEYVHRGAYPLIVTALLAGLFVLAFMRPGTATATARWPRGLVTLWVGQNLLLVASTAWRTAEYVHDYLLTRMRIAAFIWMALVALGLVLICWRLLRGKSASWLINANALAAGLVLVICSFVDFGPLAAAWNIRHAKELGGDSQPLDLCYMQNNLAGSAIVPLAQLERKPMAPNLRARVTVVRRELVHRVTKQQAGWRSWRWRDARRLDRVHALLGDADQSPHGGNLYCGGYLSPPPASPKGELTQPAQPGT